MKMLGFSLAGGLGEAAWRSRGLRVSSKDTMSYAADGEGCAARTVSTLLSTCGADPRQASVDASNRPTVLQVLKGWSPAGQSSSGVSGC